jgi:hypothetical protein
MELYQSKFTGEEIDERLEKSGVVYGTYTGDGNASKFINLGFTPSVVYVKDVDGRGASYYGGFADKTTPCSYSGVKLVEIVENGFNVFYGGTSSDTAKTNSSSNYDGLFRYIAFR